MNQSSNFPFHLYGLIIGVGVLAGFWVASRYAQLFKIRSSQQNGGKVNYKVTPDDIWGSLMWIIIPAVLGARLYHVVGLWEYYRDHVWQVFAIWSGGLGILGGIIGGIFGLWLYAKIKHIPLLYLADLGAFGLPIGQAIGRWGNYFNHELYGKPTTLPWGIYVPPDYREPLYIVSSRFHPLFLYESLSMFFVFLVLFFLFRYGMDRIKPGFYFSLYLFLYGIVRFVLEFFRIETWQLWNVPVAQAMSVFFIFISLLFLYQTRRRVL